MISEDSDYTSDVSYPVQHPCYGVDYPGGCYPNDVTMYPAAGTGYELGYSGHVGRRYFGETDDWRGYEDGSGDFYRTPMAYRCRYGADWEMAEPLSYNSRPARFYPCDR